jgi:hypothetical protein
MQALAPEDAADAAIVRARRPEDGGESSPWRLEVFFPPQDGWRAEGRNRELVLPARPDRVIVLEPPGATLGHELGEVAIFVVAAPVTLAADTAIGAGIVLMSSPQLADDVQRAMEHHPHHRRG